MWCRAAPKGSAEPDPIEPSTRSATTRGTPRPSHSPATCHAQNETGRVLQVVGRTGDLPPEELAAKLAEFVVEGMTVHRLRLQAKYEFMVESARRPAPQRSATVWQQGLRAHLESALQALGSPGPRTDAHLILATIAGLEVDCVAEEVGASQRQAIPQHDRGRRSTATTATGTATPPARVRAASDVSGRHSPLSW